MRTLKFKAQLMIRFIVLRYRPIIIVPVRHLLNKIPVLGGLETRAGGAGGL